MAYHCRNQVAHGAHRDELRDQSKQLAVGYCPGRDRCVKCRKLAWRDELVEVRELRQYLGKLRHRGCRL